MKFLYTLPDLLIILLFVLALLLIAAAMLWTVRWMGMRSPSPDESVFAQKIQDSVYVLCALVLSLSLVTTEGNIRAAEVLQIKEVAAINTLDVELARQGSDDGLRLRTALKGYTLSIIRDEWPAMTQGKGSELTAQALNPVLAAVEMWGLDGHSQGQASAGLIHAAEVLAQIRDERIEAASNSLSFTFWFSLGVCVAIYLSIFSLMGLDRFRWIVASFQIATLGVLVGMVFVFDQPYLGQTSLRPDRYIKLQETLEGRKAWVITHKRP